MKKKINKKSYSLLIFSLFFLSYYFFFLSLEKCTEGEEKCCKKFRWMTKKVIEECISCILTIISIELIIAKKISKLHFIHFVLAFILFYSYSHGIEFDNHGYYNILYFFIIVISILCLIFFLKLLLSIKKKKILLLYFELFFLIFYLGRNIVYKYIICTDWENGLNNTSIDNDKEKYGCIIQIPKFCPYKIGFFFLDKNRFYPLDCKKNWMNSRKIIFRSSKSPFINENTSHIGFPLTNKEEKYFQDMDPKQYRQLVFDNYIDMNNFTLLNLLNDKKPEISIDFSKNKNGKMNIILNYNQSLSNERKNLEKNTIPYSNNIIIIYLDSVSRAYSMRQLKKTLRFFEKFISFRGNNHPKFPYENFHSFQFFKYYSHKYFTIGNYPILFFGKHKNKVNHYINLFLKKNGYITSFCADTCYYDFTRTYHNFSFNDIYDHRYILCDPNYWGPVSKLQCFYGKLQVEFMIDYINQFWNKYKNNRKFSLLLTNFAHEGSLEKLKYIDNILYEWFNKLINENLLKDTTIFLLSDHGVAVPSIYYLNEFFQYEQVLPMLYLLINDRKNVTYELQYKYIHQNQQTFITGFDIYNTIIHLIYGDKYGTNYTKDIESLYGKSLFTKINQKNRSPKNYSLMDKHACI